MKPLTHELYQSLKTLFLALILSIGVSYVYAWTGPTATAPNNNTSAPINVGTVSQVKSGGLGVTAFTADSIALNGNTITTSGSNSTYGAVTIKGAKGGYPGINFKDSAGTNAGTLMMGPTHSGFFNNADNNWRWYTTDAGDTWQASYANATDYYIRNTGRWASQGANHPQNSCYWQTYYFWYYYYDSPYLDYAITCSNGYYLAGVMQTSMLMGAPGSMNYYCCAF